MKAMPLKQAQALLYATAQRRRNGSVKALTWKQDRLVEVELRDGAILLREQGFENSELQFNSPHDMKHALKVACDREFPRSTRVHVVERLD